MYVWVYLLTEYGHVEEVKTLVQLDDKASAREAADFCLRQAWYMAWQNTVLVPLLPPAPTEAPQKSYLRDAPGLADSLNRQ